MAHQVDGGAGGCRRVMAQRAYTLSPRCGEPELVDRAVLWWRPRSRGGAAPCTEPFHRRVEAANTTGLWSHWAGTWSPRSTRCPRGSSTWRCCATPSGCSTARRCTSTGAAAPGRALPGRGAGPQHPPLLSARGLRGAIIERRPNRGSDTPDAPSGRLERHEGTGLRTTPKPSSKDVEDRTCGEKRRSQNGPAELVARPTRTVDRDRLSRQLAQRPRLQRELTEAVEARAADVNGR